MDLRTATRLLALALAVLLVLLALVTDASARKRMERVPPEKPKLTVVSERHDPRRVIVKFSEGTDVRLHDGVLHGRGAFQSGRLAEALAPHRVGPRSLRRLFARSERELDRERVKGEQRSGRKLADLNSYYELEVPASADAGTLCDSLNALPFVELAEPAPRPAPLPVDIAPPSPDLLGAQGYRAAPPVGIGVSELASMVGADGAGLRVVDIEYAWVLDHEDLELDGTAVIDTEATASNPFPEDQGNHGTAVLGELVGRANAYGITGLAPAAEALVAPANTVEYGYNLPRALNLAAAALDAGDVILIEQQTWVCGGDYGPVEWWQPTFDAIQAATARGIVVVEAAGNGNMNLDAAACEGRFDRSMRDSGAIMVGAGEPGSRRKLGFSSHGSRVDVQGWGSDVTTAGYGSAFDPGDVRQRYTSYFNGTSSASPIVAGAVLAIQGAVLAAGLPPLEPLELRQVLVDTGSPQDAQDVSGHIGPLPDVPAVLETCASGAPVLNVSLADDFVAAANEPVTLEVSLRACSLLVTGAEITIETPDGMLAARDDGAVPDAAAADGRHTATWTPRREGLVTLLLEAREAGSVVATRALEGRVVAVPVYEARSVPLRWVDATAGTELALAVDDGSVETPIGFAFPFQGDAYETVRVSSNGYLTFGPQGGSYANVAIPSVSEPNGLIAPYWDDLNPGVGGGVYAFQDGAAPNRRLTIEWHAVPYYGDSSATATFEVTLFESGAMRFQYLDVAAGAGANGASATAGIENEDGTRGLELSFDQPALPSGTAIRIAGAPACRDGRDNDGDGLVDHPADDGCFSDADGTESVEPRCGLLGIELLLVLALGSHRFRSRTRRPH